MTDEQKAKISAALMGHVNSPEARAKMSVAKMGHPTSPETRAKLSAAKIGNMYHLGHHPPAESVARSAAKHWKGGRRITKRRTYAKRRGLGYVYLNSWFLGCEGHHVDNDQVIHMPKALHRSIYHNQHTGKGMAQINALALAWLEQTKEVA